MRTSVAGSLFLALTALGGACSSGSHSATGATPGTTVASATHCEATPVHYKRLPGATADSVPSTLPWVAASGGRIYGVLFYYSAPTLRQAHTSRLVIGVNGQIGRRVNTKILWWVRGGATGAEMLVIGTRLDGHGSFREAWPAAAGSDTNPSIVTVPKTGCWRIDLRAGTVTGSLTVGAQPL